MSLEELRTVCSRCASVALAHIQPQLPTLTVGQLYSLKNMVDHEITRRLAALDVELGKESK